MKKELFSIVNEWKSNPNSLLNHYREIGGDVNALLNDYVSEKLKFDSMSDIEKKAFLAEKKVSEYEQENEIRKQQELQKQVELKTQELS